MLARDAMSSGHKRAGAWSGPADPVTSGLLTWNRAMQAHRQHALHEDCVRDLAGDTSSCYEAVRLPAAASMDGAGEPVHA